MTCPKCRTEFDGVASVCPECGVNILRNVSGVMKTSTVLISVGEEQGSYRSINDVPERLRRQLIASTNSENAGTILIADRAGKEQLTQVIARSEADSAASEQPVDLLRRRVAGLPWIAWAGIVMVLSALIVIGLLFGFHW